MADVQLSTLGSVIKTAYEAEADTNAFTDAEKTKLADITTNAIADIVEDITPQLGGSLDVNGQKIVSAANGNIDIEPNGTGNVLLGNFTFDADQTVGAGQDNYVFTYDNATGLISLEAAAAGSGDFKADGTVDMTGEFRTDVGTFDSDVANGASAVAYSYDTAVTYSTSGAKLAKWLNNTTEKLSIDKEGIITGAANSALVMGDGSTVSTTACIAVGRYNSVSGQYGAAFGARAAATVPGMVSIGCSEFNTGGAAQSNILTLANTTTDATQTDLQASNNSALYIPADTSWAFSVLVVARSDETDGNESAAYRLEGLLTRDESNNTAIVGSVTKTVIAESAGATAWDVTAEADNTNEALAIKVTGEAATNIRWVAKVDISQVTYA